MAESGGAPISRLEERLANSKERWYFTKEELTNSPSRLHGVDPAKELSYRQQAANLIKDVGHRISVNQLCIATGVVYMHRFFMVHSFKSFPKFTVATAALFLAGKVEEQPRKLEYVARVSYACQNRDSKPLDGSSDVCKQLMEEISYYELLLLQTLGFEVAVEHPQQHVVMGTQLVRASRDLSQTAYFMSLNSLLLTTFCLQYPPTVVACVCIHLACRWKGIEIPLSADGKPWWEYVDKNVTLNQLNEYTGEFLRIYEMCPNKLQKKIMESVKMGQQSREKGESSGSSRPTSDKSKGPPPHKQPSSSSQQQKPHKSGSHTVPSLSGQPHKHSSHPSKHPGHHGPSTGHHNALNGSQAQTISHSTSHDSKSTHSKPPAISSSTRPVSKHHARSLEEHHRHKAAAESKHLSSQMKHHHHQTAPGHHPNASKPPDGINKHRHPPSEHKYRPIANHDGRPHNSLKRPLPCESLDVKRVKLGTPSGGNLFSLSTDTNNLPLLPPLPSQQSELPPLPPPLPSEPPPMLGGDFPPPPPPTP